MDALTKEMQEIAQKSFGTASVPELLQRVRTDRQYPFKSRDDLIGYSKAALDRGDCPCWLDELRTHLAGRSSTAQN